MDNIRPLRTDEDLAWAIAEVERYFRDEPEPGTPDADRFDVLSSLIEAYEDRHYPIEAPEPVDYIKAHMAMTGKTQAELASIIGSAPRASEILNRKRALTVDMIYRLGRAWAIPADRLVAPYHLAGNARRGVPPEAKVR